MQRTELFVEVSDGLKRKIPPEIIPLSKLPEWQEQHKFSTNGLFSSICCYPTDDPYVGGIMSPYYADFDNEENPEKARKEVVAVVKKLKSDYDIPIDIISICFSGMKGFSLTVDQKVFNSEASADLPSIWKSISQELASKLKLKTIDMGIYERRRLWRLPNSKHQKTGLYKIPIDSGFLEKLNITEIKELAALPQRAFEIAEAQQSVPKAEKLFQEHKAKVENWANERKKTFEKNELTTFVDDPPCIKHLLETGANKGERNNSTFHVAIYYASKGLSYDEVLGTCNSFNAKCDDPLTEREIATLVKSAMSGVEEKRYSVGCSTELLSANCDKPNCPFFQKQETKENKSSCGDDLADRVFEQIENQQYLVFNKETGEVTRQKTVDGIKPINQLLWKTPNNTLDFGSEQELFDEIRKYLYEYIDIAEGYDVLAAWVLSSWIPEKWHAVPYLSFFGPPGSGKTWALEVLASIGFRPFLSASATLASIFRVIDQWHPTMFLDETEVYMKKDRDEILNLLNAGYRKDFPAVRVEETDKGLVPRVFDLFGFKALAGTKEFIQTLRSRCVILTMNKAVRKINTKIDLERAMTLRRKLLLYRFKKLSEKEIQEAPDVLNGRLKELFDPLIIVAPENAKNTIIAQAKKIEDERSEEEQASPESIVFKALLRNYRQTQEQKIAIDNITRLANENHPLEEVLSSVAVGRICSKLGYKRTLSNGRRAVFWNKDLAERLIRRYGQPDEKQVSDGLTDLTGDQRTIEKQRSQVLQCIFFILGKNIKHLFHLSMPPSDYCHICQSVNFHISSMLQSKTFVNSTVNPLVVQSIRIA